MRRHPGYAWSGASSEEAPFSSRRVADSATAAAAAAATAATAFSEFDAPLPGDDTVFDGVAFDGAADTAFSEFRAAAADAPLPET